MVSCRQRLQWTQSYRPAKRSHDSGVTSGAGMMNRLPAEGVARVNVGLAAEQLQKDDEFTAQGRRCEWVEI